MNAHGRASDEGAPTGVTGGFAAYEQAQEVARRWRQRGAKDDAAPATSARGAGGDERSAQDFKHRTLSEDETLAGVGERLPRAGAPGGTFLVVGTEDGLVGVHATATSGATVLERLLRDAGVALGDFVSIVYEGKRRQRDGRRRYRSYTLEILRRAAQAGSDVMPKPVMRAPVFTDRIDTRPNVETLADLLAADLEAVRRAFNGAWMDAAEPDDPRAIVWDWTRPDEGAAPDVAPLANGEPQ